MAEQWYYAKGSQRMGPVSQDDFNTLVGNGTIGRETLVWRSGMQEWKRYGEVARGSMESPTATAVAGGEHACVECNRIFPEEEMLKYGDMYVCSTCKPVFFQRVKEGAPLPTELVYAGFWIRFVAYFLDGIIVGIVQFVALQLPFMMIAGASEDPSVQATAFGVYYLLSLAVNWGYHTWFVGRFGATPGKMACGLKIVRADGDRVSYARAFGRILAQILSGLILLIGFIMVAFDREKRALHDHICDTRVIRVRR